MNKNSIIYIIALLYLLVGFIILVSAKHNLNHDYGGEECDSLKILSIDSYIVDGVVLNARYLNNEDHHIKLVLKEFVQGNDSVIIGESYCFKIKKFFPWDSTEIMSSSFEMWVDLNERDAVLLDFIRYFEIFYVIEIL